MEKMFGSMMHGFFNNMSEEDKDKMNTMSLPANGKPLSSRSKK